MSGSRWSGRSHRSLIFYFIRLDTLLTFGQLLDNLIFLVALTLQIKFAHDQLLILILYFLYFAGHFLKFIDLLLHLVNRSLLILDCFELPFVVKDDFSVLFHFSLGVF